MSREIWDEDRWEEYLRESDKRSELYHQLFEAYIRDNPPPDEQAPEDERETYWENLHAHLAEQMGWTPQDDDDAPEWFGDLDFFDDDDLDDDEGDPGEEWKTGLSEDFPEEQDYEELPIYQHAFEFGQAVYSWVDTLPESDRESVIVELCSNALQIAAKIAGGHGLGYDLEMLGGNIAQCKRALKAANRSLDALKYVREIGLIGKRDYRRLYELGYELRNGLGVYVQDLRERFERGVE